MPISDYWSATKAAISAFRDDLDMSRAYREEAEQHYAREAATHEHDIEDLDADLDREERAEKDRQECYTKEIIDPVTGKEYTVNVYPYSWGYKYDVRDNEQGTVVQDGGVKPSFSIAMEDGRQWVETRDKEASYHRQQRDFKECAPIHVQKSSDQRTAEFMGYPANAFEDPKPVRVQISDDEKVAKFMGYPAKDNQPSCDRDDELER